MLVKQSLGLMRIIYLRAQGATIDFSTSLAKINYFWPHKIFIGKNCIIEQNVFFKFDGIFSEGKSIIINNNVFIGFNYEFNINNKLEIGSNSLIGSGSKFIDHDHGMSKNSLMKDQPCPSATIKLEEDVWLGCNVVVLKGVHIGQGSIVAAGSVVNKSIPEYEIWGGIPAKKIKNRD